MAERTAPNTLAVSLMAGLAGAGLALLFAPSSGRETRAKLKNKAVELNSKAHEKLEMGKDKARDLKDKISSSADQAKEDVEEKINTGRARMDKSWEKEA